MGVPPKPQKNFKKCASLLTLLLAIVNLAWSTPVAALSAKQRQVMDAGALHVDVEEAASSACASVLPGDNNREKAWNFLTGEELSPEQAAGIIGNLMAESGEDINPEAVNSAGYRGIAQWSNPGRWEELVAWAEGNDNNPDESLRAYTDPASFDTQLRFMWYEAGIRQHIASDPFEGSNQDGIRQQDDVAHAAWYWGRYYEVAIVSGSTSHEPLTNVQHLDRRTDYAEQVFDDYSGSGGGGSEEEGSGGCALGEGVSLDEFYFPLITTKSDILAGTSNYAGEGPLVWCYNSSTNCHHNYNAADIFAPEDTTQVIAAVGGTVISATEELSPECGSGGTSVGSRVTIKNNDDDDGRVYYYAHMAYGSLLVSDGDSVQAGQVIGLVGDSAQAVCTAPHLHFDILPASYEHRVSCSGADCSSEGFINVQPTLIELYPLLPD